MVQPGVLWSKCCPTIPFVLGGVIFQNFHSTTPATISIHFPRWFLAASPTWWSFNHDNKSESLSPEAAATCYDRKLRAPRSQIPPLLSFFFGPGRKLLRKGEVSQLHCTLKYFFGTMALPTLKQLKRRKMVKKISQPRLGHGRAGQLVICCLHRF